jgi:hypothetical protein
MSPGPRSGSQQTVTTRASGWTCPRRFPEHGMNFAGGEVEIDAGERFELTEAF